MRHVSYGRMLSALAQFSKGEAAYCKSNTLTFAAVQNIRPMSHKRYERILTILLHMASNSVIIYPDLLSFTKHSTSYDTYAKDVYFPRYHSW